MITAKQKVCLVTGVGPGTGKAIVNAFAAQGYRVAMIARNEERLLQLANETVNTVAFPCDVSDSKALKETVNQIKYQLGDPSVIIHNAVGGTFGNFMDIDPDDLEANFRVNTMALLHIARMTIDSMIANGEGAIIGTGNTSAYRGKANFAGFAPTKAAQRILLESIAREVGKHGIHAAYVAIDAVIDVEWARKMAPDKPDEFFANPNDIAQEVYHITHQPKSTWSSDVTIRPFAEVW